MRIRVAWNPRLAYVSGYTDTMIAKALPLLLLCTPALCLRADMETTEPEPAPSPAAEVAPVPTHDNSAVVLAKTAPEPLPTPARDAETRSVSSNLAAALSSGMPRYNPPKPTPTGDPQDLRDIDKPRNDIPRLPKYVVRESRPPVFSQRDLSTDRGLVSLSFKAHPGLNLGNFFGLNSGVAREMIYDDERLANIKDLNETAYAFARGGDKAEADLIQKATQDAFMRSDDSWNSGPAGTLLGGIGK
jgi:hypothetical protein